MNISSQASVALLNSGGVEGGAARQDYSVAVAQKINQQVKLEGDAAIKLIESVTTPPFEAPAGKNLNSYA